MTRIIIYYPHMLCLLLYVECLHIFLIYIFENVFSSCFKKELRNITAYILWLKAKGFMMRLFLALLSWEQSSDVNKRARRNRGGRQVIKKITWFGGSIFLGGFRNTLFSTTQIDSSQKNQHKMRVPRKISVKTPTATSLADCHINALIDEKSISKACVVTKPILDDSASFFVINVHAAEKLNSSALSDMKSLEREALAWERTGKLIFFAVPQSVA